MFCWLYNIFVPQAIYYMLSLVHTGPPPYIYIRLFPKAGITQINTDTVNRKHINIVNSLLLQVLFPSPLLPLLLVCIHSRFIHFITVLTYHMSPFNSILYLSILVLHCSSASPHFSALLHLSLYLSFGRRTGRVPSVNSPYNHWICGAVT